MFYDIDDIQGSYPAYKVLAVDTTAAGDCFNAALAVGRGESGNLTDSIHLATKAAAITVTCFGAQTSLPTRIEIDQFIV